MEWLGELYGRLFSTATVSATADGGVLIRSAPGRYVLWILLFLVLLPAARWCWRRRIGGNLAPGFFFASFTIPLIVVPGIAQESIAVTPAGLAIRTGFWFAPTERSLPFADLDEIVETSKEMEQRGAERRDRVWSFRYRSGSPRRLKLPDLLDANRQPVIEYLHRQGLAVREA